MDDITAITTDQFVATMDFSESLQFTSGSSNSQLPPTSAAVSRPNERRIAGIVFEERVVNFPSRIIQHMKCPVCMGIARDGHKVLGCDHLFCRSCLLSSQKKDGFFQCPYCRHTSEGVTQATNANAVIEEMEIRCVYEVKGCNVVTSLGKLGEHEYICTFGSDRDWQCEGCGGKFNERVVAPAQHSCVKMIANRLYNLESHVLINKKAAWKWMLNVTALSTQVDVLNDKVNNLEGTMESLLRSRKSGNKR